MPESNPLPQIPQHVAAQLTHLLSRPGVESTLILSRKNGSIIQATGQLANPSNNTPPNATPPDSAPAPTSTSTSIPETIPSASNPGQEAAVAPSANESSAVDTPSSSNQQPKTPYKPSQAETLAAHIHAFVTSASALSVSLSRSPSESTNNKETDYDSRENALRDGSIGVEGESGDKATTDDGETVTDRDDDDEVKLLRLRSKIHEIIIIPDRRFLLCVVHAVSAGAGGNTGSGHSR